MKQITFALLSLGVLTFIPVFAEDDKPGIFFLTIEYDKGKLSLKDIFQRSGDPPGPYVGSGDYKYQIISFKDEIIYSSKFGVPTEIYYDEFDPTGKLKGGGTTTVDKADFAIIAPYYSNAKNIKLLKNDEVLLVVDVSGFAEKQPVNVRRMMIYSLIPILSIYAGWRIQKFWALVGINIVIGFGLGLAVGLTIPYPSSTIVAWGIEIPIALVIVRHYARGYNDKVAPGGSQVFDTEK